MNTRFGSPAGRRGTPGRRLQRGRSQAAAGWRRASRKEAVMPGKAALASVCILTIVLALLVAGCGKDYRQVAVIDRGKGELVTFRPPPQEPPKVWEPGRVLVFPPRSPPPGAPPHPTRKEGGA